MEPPAYSGRSPPEQSVAAGNPRCAREGAGVISRRQLLGAGVLAAAARRPKRVAAVVTIYTHNSHADVIVSKLLQGENLDFRSRKPDLQLAGLYVDQFPEGDMSRKLAAEHG